MNIRMRILTVLAMVTLSFTASTEGSNYYVDAAQSDNSGDGLSWATAKQTIQAAIDSSSTNDIVWVTNGTYNIGGAVAAGQLLTNRVCVNKAITVQSVNGPEFTIIVGASGSNGSNDVDAVRGVYITANAILSGFTITNGHTSSAYGNDAFGGGIFMMTGGMATTCILTGNSAKSAGGGAYGGTLNHSTLTANYAIESGGGACYGTLNHCILSDNAAGSTGGGSSGGALNYCILSDNSAGGYGGGSYYETLNNCILSGNSALNSGGAEGGVLNNCTLTGNTANKGGGTRYATLINCIVWGNTAASYKDTYNAYALYSCASDLTGGSTGCITNEPAFVNRAIGRFDLQAQSPCINAGTNEYASGDTDLAGNPRIILGTIDMGAYESPAISNSYMITTTAGNNGEIVPANPLVFETCDQPVSILPARGYYVESLTVDGIPQTPSESHTFNNVQTTHTIEATFATSPHALTVENGTGDGSYIIWTEVDVVADAAPDGLVFRRWETEPAQYISAVGNPYNAATTFTMLESNVVLTAIYGVAYYVDAARPDDSGDGLSWATAKQTIQAAVDLTDDIGCTVWVTNGTYNIGGAVATGHVLTNRVCINKAMTVRSVNGPEVTIIEGASGSNGGFAVDAVRGIYITDGATLSGFTVTNGHTVLSYDNNGNGGGVFMEPFGSANNCTITGNSARYGGGAYGGTLTDCILNKNSAELGGGSHSVTLGNCSLTGNAASRGGGGAYGGTLFSSTLVGNSASSEGGGVHNSTLYNCRITDNQSGIYGGGAHSAVLNNCTISANSASSEGGGIRSGAINNCIVWGNFAGSHNDTYNVSASYSCASDITAGVDGCITNEPHFVNRAIGRLDLLAHSPCINAGNNISASGTTDLVGNPRIIAGTVDMGAYESPDVTNSYLITTSPGENGTIEPDSPVAYEGYDLPLSILPLPGYYVDSLTVDGSPVLPSSSYIFSDVQTTHTIAATFAIAYYTLTVENGTGDGSYTIWPEVNVVADEPVAGFVFLKWTTEPVQYSSSLSDPYNASTTITMPESDIVLTANYGPIYYVDASQPDDSGTGLSWATAKQTIQAAVDLADDGGLVCVTNGIYNIGGAVAAGQSLTNRVCIDKALTVQSVNGPEFTIIEGAAGSNGGQDADAVRGVYIADQAVLTGFSITNGYTMASATSSGDRDGGGIFLEPDGIATNCIISGNTANYGGGTSYGTLNNCTISYNSASISGGGSRSGTLNNCTLNGNSADDDGGGAYYGTLNHCTLNANSAADDGGGTYQGTLNNCTLNGNLSSSYGGGAYYSTLNNCVLTGNRSVIGSYSTRLSKRGGGTYGGTLNNCTLSGNSAYLGGGTFQGTLNNCTLIENSAGDGGGTCQGTLNNCILIRNSATHGGGSYSGTLNNCTLIENSANSGAAAWQGTLKNCIVWGIPDGWYGEYIWGANVSYSCAPDITAGVNGCITNNPLFVDAASGDYTLQSNSPCINAGNNAYAAGNTDFSGDARIVYGVVDMGAYEFSGPITGIPDFDNDGIDDTWEGIYFGSTVGCDPNGHSDSDPFSNQDEYIAGTDPTDGASFFMATNSSQIAEGYRIEWDAVSNRLYSVLWANSLTNTFLTLESGIAYPQSSYTDTNALDNAAGFYRLEVQMQD